MKCVRCDVENKVRFKAVILENRCTCNDQGSQCEELPEYTMVFFKEDQDPYVVYMCSRHYFLTLKASIMPENQPHAIDCNKKTEQ